MLKSPRKYVFLEMTFSLPIRVIAVLWIFKQSSTKSIKLLCNNTIIISGLVVERSPCVQEVIGSIPGKVHRCLALGIKRLDQGNIVGLLIVDCILWPGGVVYQVPVMWYSGVATLYLLQVDHGMT